MRQHRRQGDKKVVERSTAVEEDGGGRNGGQTGTRATRSSCGGRLLGPGLCAADREHDREQQLTKERLLAPFGYNSRHHVHSIQHWYAKYLQ